MSGEVITDLMRSALFIAMLMVAVIIVPSLLVGLLVSMFQAATQINEQTLSFLPRFMVTFIVLSVAGPWLGQMVFDFTERLILDIPSLIG